MSSHATSYFPAMTPFDNEQDYAIDTPSIYSNDADDDENYSVWPRLIGLDDDELEFNDSQRMLWAERPYPPELQYLPEDCPEELARVIKESLSQDLYANSVPANRQGGSTLPGSHLAANHGFGTPPSDSSSNNSGLKSSNESIASSGPTTATSLSKGALDLTSGGPIPPEQLPHMSDSFSFRECASCFTEIPDEHMITLTCHHKYCVKCLQNLAMLAVNSERQFPPKCCLSEIPQDMILQHLDREQREAYLEKLEEYSIPPHDRWYCPSHGCRRWIAQKHIRAWSSTQQCPSCRMVICGLCRGISHRYPEDCPRTFVVPDRGHHEGWNPTGIAAAIEKLKAMEARDSRAEASKEDENSGAKQIQRLQAVETAMRNLREELYRINKLQQYRISERHRVGAHNLHSRAICDQTEWEQRLETLTAALRSNFRLRKEMIQRAHESELQTMLRRHEEEEDDTLISLARLLKGKVNRQEREHSIMEKLRAAQESEKEHLLKSHVDGEADLEAKGELEIAALQAGLELDLEDIRDERTAVTRELGQQVSSDRHWFDAVVEKRAGLLDQYRTDLIEGRRQLPPLVIEPRTPEEPLRQPPTLWHIDEKLAALPRIDTNLSSLRPHRMDLPLEPMVYG